MRYSQKLKKRNTIINLPGFHYGVKGNTSNPPRIINFWLYHETDSWKNKYLQVNCLHSQEYIYVLATTGY